MKLAEALIRIKDLKGKAAALQLIVQNDAVFEALNPNDVVPDIEHSLEDLISVSTEIANLKARITRTNVASGATDKIHSMESLRSIVSKLEELSRYKQSKTILKTVNYGDVPIKVETHATYDVEEWTERLNDYRDDIRAIDIDLQKLNWEIDLAE